MTFDVNDFRAKYPQFTNFTDAQLTYIWDNACIISGLADDTSMSEDTRRNLLYMLTCHLATLQERSSAGGIGSVTEGSVSVSYTQPPAKGMEDWYYNQTPCGAAYWQAIKSKRIGGMWFCGH